ncbi:MAG: acyl-CoA dehydrogenase, partial [Legionella sp.]
MINVVNVSMLEQFDESNFLLYADKIIHGEIITSICNNEALNHGSNLNGMSSYIKENNDDSYDINVNKRVITNVGAADLLFVSVPIWGEQENKFAILLFEGSEIPQMSLSHKLSGLASCPTGSIIAELKNYKQVRLVATIRKSLFVMRHMYNMERFLLGCIMTGILKKILKYALDEKDNDLVGKFNNQYLQDKIIKIFDSFVRLESLMINCIQYMHTQTPIESILSVIKLD